MSGYQHGHLPDVVERVVAEIRGHAQVIAIFLFGSWAQGEQMPISDADIAVLLDTPDKSNEADIGSMYSPTVDRDEERLKEVTFRVMRQYHEMEWHYRRYVEEVLR